MVKSAIACLLMVWAAVHAQENAFSKNAVRPDEVGNRGNLVAPDGKTSVLLGSVLRRGQYHLLLTFDLDSKKLSFDVGRAVGAELLWSPDSNALAATISDVSPNGVYDLFIFQLGPDTVREINATEAVRKAFGRPVACAYPESPNVAAVAWVRSSARLLVAAQILDHSVCDSFGTFKMYELSVPDLKVQRTYDQLEAKRLFGSDLGVFLQHARDTCITDPKSCEVPANHKAAQTHRPTH